MTKRTSLTDWDVTIITPLPRQSGTIRVKLIYEEPGRPIPVEDFLERIGAELR